MQVTANGEQVTVTIPDGAQPNQPFAIQLPGVNPVTTPRGVLDHLSASEIDAERER